MWVPADVEEAIAGHPDAVADAISALNLEAKVPLIDLTILQKSAELAQMPFEKFLVFWLDQKDLLESFVVGLQSRGVPIDLQPIALDVGNVDQDLLARFATASKAFGCRIRKDGDVVGSGILIGPNTVLTAWHVIRNAMAVPGTDPDAPDIQVILSDNQKVPARPPTAYESQASHRELGNQFPKNDDEVKDLHDVAVLRLSRAAGALLGSARLPETPATYVANGPVFVVHYPNGVDWGLGVGTLARIRRLNARWSHTAATASGSSGGGCFDATLTLLGIHQGKDPRQRGRLVPVSQFYDRLKEIVANDQAPPRMWSLDGTPHGDFVIGRQALFEAFSIAQRNPRVRGIRIRRADATGNLSGLPFSYRIVEQLVARQNDLRLIRISFEVMTGDIADEIARRATDAGIPVDPVPAKAGVAEGQSAPEAVGADRGRRAAAILDAKAAQLGVRAWVYIDHPAVAFGDIPRPALEAFVDASLRLDNIRLVVAGFEAVALPGQDFYAPPDPLEQGSRGFMNETLSGFVRSDVALFVMDAAAAARKEIGNDLLDDIVDEALDGLPNVNGTYEPWVAGDVAKRVKPRIEKWFEQ